MGSGDGEGEGVGVRTFRGMVEPEAIGEGDLGTVMGLNFGFDGAGGEASGRSNGGSSKSSPSATGRGSTLSGLLGWGLPEARLAS